MGGAGVFLLIRNAKEDPVQMPDFLKKSIAAFRNTILKKV